MKLQSLRKLKNTTVLVTIIFLLVLYLSDAWLPRSGFSNDATFLSRWPRAAFNDAKRFPVLPLFHLTLSKLGTSFRSIKNVYYLEIISNGITGFSGSISSHLIKFVCLITQCLTTQSWVMYLYLLRTYSGGEERLWCQFPAVHQRGESVEIQGMYYSLFRVVWLFHGETRCQGSHRLNSYFLVFSCRPSRRFFAFGGW